jgi:hypothetical protein
LPETYTSITKFFGFEKPLSFFLTYDTELCNIIPVIKNQFFPCNLKRSNRQDALLVAILAVPFLGDLPKTVAM